MYQELLNNVDHLRAMNERLQQAEQEMQDEMNGVDLENNNKPVI